MNSANLKRKTFFFNPLRSPLLWTFFTVHLLVAVVLGRVYAFAPDERGYLETFKKVYKGDFDIHSVLGWQNAQVNFLRMIYSPGRLLQAVGVSDFMALRCVSILFSGFSLYLLLCVAKEVNSKVASKSLVAIAIIPSSFLWMTLGLREPFLFASMSMLCTGMYLVTRADHKTGSIFWGLGFLMALETKPDIALLVFCSSLLWIAIDLLRTRKTQTVHALFALAFVIPVLLDFQGVRVVAQTVRAQLTSVSSTGATSIATYADQNAVVAAQENTILLSSRRLRPKR